jgi:hypothetical protein
LERFVERLFKESLRRLKRRTPLESARVFTFAPLAGPARQIFRRWDESRPIRRLKDFSRRIVR